MKGHVTEGAVISLGFSGRLGILAEVASSLGATHGMEHLCAGRGRDAHNIQCPAAIVGRHLASAAGRIGGRAHGLQQHLGRREAQRQAQRAIAIVGKEPVVTGTHGQRRAHAQRLVARAGDLEVDFLLAFEKDLAVIHAAGKKHQPVDFNQLPRA